MRTRAEYRRLACDFASAQAVLAEELGVESDDSDDILQAVQSLKTRVADLEAQLAAAHSEPEAWNKCPKCGQLVDIGDDAFDGTEHKCGCGAVCVVCECSSFFLYLGGPEEEPDEEPDEQLEANNDLQSSR